MVKTVLGQRKSLHQKGDGNSEAQAWETVAASPPLFIFSRTKPIESKMIVAQVDEQIRRRVI
jgi:hypothetical protein